MKLGKQILIGVLIIGLLPTSYAINEPDDLSFSVMLRVHEYSIEVRAAEYTGKPAINCKWVEYDWLNSMYECDNFKSRKVWAYWFSFDNYQTYKYPDGRGKN